MKKEYKKPEMNIIELSQLDVIATSGEDNPFLNGGAVKPGDSGWSGTF